MPLIIQRKFVLAKENKFEFREMDQAASTIVAKMPKLSLLE